MNFLPFLRAGWQIARLAAPAATQNLVSAVVDIRDPIQQSHAMAGQMNAMANLAAAYRQYESIARRSSDPKVMAAYRRLGEELADMQTSRSEMIARKIKEAAET